MLSLSKIHFNALTFVSALLRRKLCYTHPHFVTEHFGNNINLSCFVNRRFTFAIIDIMHCSCATIYKNLIIIGVLRSGEHSFGCVL